MELSTKILLVGALVFLAIEIGRYFWEKQKREKAAKDGEVVEIQPETPIEQQTDKQEDTREIRCCLSHLEEPEDAWDRDYVASLDGRKQQSFAAKLREMLQAKGLASVDVYKKADIDRRLFYKLKQEYYHPRKKTVLALALAMELTLPEAEELLLFAGYAFAPNSWFDLIVSDCLQKQMYNLIEVNKILYRYTKETL